MCVYARRMLPPCVKKGLITCIVEGAAAAAAACKGGRGIDMEK